MASYTYIGDSGPDGVVVGVSTTSKVAFGGATPVAISALTSYATSAVGTASSTDVSLSPADFALDSSRRRAATKSQSAGLR